MNLCLLHVAYCREKDGKRAQKIKNEKAEQIAIVNENLGWKRWQKKIGERINTERLNSLWERKPLISC